ncbi:MAG: DUF2452 domain-containing protein [Sandaracinaceae bacterium]|nr:DUF2452 domain-containing protein [Sandaracinaceae bacterium]MDW8245205.1 DUF2452 domain-containing protein [Sandaracinaceae bacterium]
MSKHSEPPLGRYEGPRQDGPPHLSPYPLSRLSPPYDIVDMAKAIAEADAMLGAVASAELALIASQIRALQEKARAILERVQESLAIHQVACHFPKRPGQIYHLYERKDGSRWLSIVGPEEWGGAPPGSSYIASYRLEADMSFTRLGTESSPPFALGSELLAACAASKNEAT